MSARRIVLLVLILVVAVLFMPSRFGGPATYVTTHGNSMEPLMHSGDLIIARSQSGYREGDIVAFHSETINTVVLHRIIEAGPSGTYITKGDNNSWLDPDTLTNSDILGVQWIFVPQGGAILARYASPPMLAGMLFLLLMIGSAAAQVGHNRARKRRHEMGTAAPASTGIDKEWWIARRQELLTAAAVTAALGLVLSMVAWSKPATTASAVTTQVPQSMTFTYRADVRESPAYQGTEVTAPEPVFRKLAQKVQVGYAYQGLPGEVTPEVRLSTPAGWQWLIPGDTTVPAPDGKARGSLELDLEELEALAVAGARAAQIPLGQITIDVVPAVTSDGERFEPALSLTMDSQVLRPTTTDESALTVKENRQQTTTQRTPNAISLLMLELPVWPARLLGLFMVLGGIGAWLVARRLPEPDTTTHLSASEKRIAQMIVPVSFVDDSGPVVDVTDLDALARIAKRYALVILHVSNAGGDIYYVRDTQTTYRWMAPPRTANQPGPSLAPWAY